MLSTKFFSTNNASRPKDTENFKYVDCVFVGGGIVGLASAYTAISKFPHLKYCLLEKENTLGKMVAY